MLVYLNESDFLVLPAQVQDWFRDECVHWHDRLCASGHSAGGLRLHPVSTATTLRRQGGKFEISDGPFAETKEILDGFVILECRDLDEAIALARSFHPLPAGFSLELRPVISDGVRRIDAT